jgi:DNA-binding NarL/FixJ family response regulator
LSERRIWIGRTLGDMCAREILAMTNQMTIVIAEHIDLLFDALTVYLDRFAPSASVIRVTSWSELTDCLGKLLHCSLLILENSLPEFPGSHADGSIPGQLGQLPLVLLTDEWRQGDMMRAMNGGAKAYIPRRTPGPIVMAALALADYVPRRGVRAAAVSRSPAGFGRTVMRPVRPTA